MCGNRTHGIYQNRYREATPSCLGDMMMRTYANKNIWAVLKQEMKNCNITKTFPRADVWARGQLFRTTVADSTVAAQHGGSCAETKTVRAQEGKVPTSLGGRWAKNQTCRKLPQKAKSTSTGEIKHPECSPPQRQTPNFSRWIHRDVGVHVKNSWLFFLSPSLPWMSMHYFSKSQKDKGSVEQSHIYHLCLTSLEDMFMHILVCFGGGTCWTTHSFVLGLRPQRRAPSRRNALGAVLSSACLIQSPRS